FSWDSPLFFLGSWTGLQKGIDGFADPNYYAQLCTKKNSTLKLTDMTHFLLFIFREICKSEKTKCIELFSKKYPEIINFAADNAPELFVNEEAINTCFKDDIARQNETKIRLKLKSPDQFVKDCVGKIFHNLPSGQQVVVNFIIESKPEPVPVLEFESDDYGLSSLLFEMGEGDKVKVEELIVEPKPKPVPNLEFESDDSKVLHLEIDENGDIIVAGNVAENSN
ncbi:MAG: hypothetical protein ACRCRR_02985, partial [Rickettsia sp.]